MVMSGDRVDLTQNDPYLIVDNSKKYSASITCCMTEFSTAEALRFTSVCYIEDEITGGLTVAFESQMLEDQQSCHSSYCQNERLRVVQHQYRTGTYCANS